MVMMALFVIGRILLGGYFLYNGFLHLKQLNNYTGYAQSKGVPSPKAAVITTGMMLLVGGLSVVTGYFMVLGLWLLVLFLVPTTFMMHKFWTITDPQARTMEQINFLKNLALVGAILALSAVLVIAA